MISEDEAFKELEERIANAPKIVLDLHAVSEAQKFVDDRSAAELSIYTLRKAFEVGYRRGWEDAKR